MSDSEPLSTVVRAGKTLETLQAIRDQIAADLDHCDSMRDKAALYLRLADILERIEEVAPPEAKGDTIDEISARRAARRAGTAARTSRAKRSG